MKTRTIFAAIAAILIISLAGCAVSAVQTLELVVSAAEIALPLIAPSAGVDPATVTAVDGYLAAVSTAVSKASDILAGSGTNAQKAAEITIAFANIADPIVPAKYQGLANAVAQVAAAVEKFLLSQPAAAPQSSAKYGSPRVAMPGADLAKLAQIKARAQKVLLQTQR